MPWVAPLIGAAATIGSAAISASSKGGGGDDGGGSVQQASVAPALATWNLGNQMTNLPWREVPYADMNQGWWNMGGSPPTTQIPEYQRWGGYQKFGQPAPTYRTYGGADPTYQGLDGGDYTRLETSLRTPGEIAAKRAFQDQQRQLSDVMGGRGAYGSSAATRAMNNDAWGNYLNTLATNASQATAQRYGFQQTDLGRKLQADTTAWQGRMAENQAANNQAMGAWSALLGENQVANQMSFNENQAANQYGMNRAIQQNAIDQAPWQWEVNKAQGYWNALLGERQWTAGQRDSTFGNILNVGRMFDTSGAAAQDRSLDLQQQKLNQGNSWGGPLGAIGGSLLGQSGGYLSSMWGNQKPAPGQPYGTANPSPSSTTTYTNAWTPGTGSYYDPNVQ